MSAMGQELGNHLAIAMEPITDGPRS